MHFERKTTSVQLWFRRSARHLRHRSLIVTADLRDWRIQWRVSDRSKSGYEELTLCRYEDPATLLRLPTIGHGVGPGILCRSYASLALVVAHVNHVKATTSTLTTAESIILLGCDRHGDTRTYSSLADNRVSGLNLFTPTKFICC